MPKSTMLKRVSAMVLITTAALLSACTGTRPMGLGVVNNQLSPCPESPNCVSSFEDKSDDIHYIEAIQIQDNSPQKTWSLLQSLIKQDNSADIIDQDDHYIYAEYTSDIMRFVDDTEFLLDPKNQQIHVRSASRLGHKDFDVNRERIEAIRSLLQP